MRYTLYVDESGDHIYKNMDRVSNRYLALTGVAIESEYYRKTLQPNFEVLKQKHFPFSPDYPCVLHREDIYNRRGQFSCLCDPTCNANWEDDFIEFIKTADIRLFTIVIDKENHLKRYEKTADHPYHYCLTMLLERYRGFLMYVKSKGDVLAESRGGKEDLKLKLIYKELYDWGTYYISAQEFQKVLTSKEIKMKKKEHNIAGLQLADLLAHPAKTEILISNGIISEKPTSYGMRLAKEFNSKYDKIGKKLLH